jgi:hypothetical protein
MPKRSQLTIADVQGMTFPELERFHRQGYDYSDYKDLTVMYALQDKIRKDKAFFASDASEKTKQSYAKAKEAKDEKMMKIIIDAWYKKHKNHFNAERAEKNRMNAEIQKYRNQHAKEERNRANQKQAQATFAARTNKKNLKDMNTCAELEQGLQDVYAELMLYKPVSDYAESMFMGYFEDLKANIQETVDGVKAGNPIPAGFAGNLKFAVDDCLDSHMTSARLGEKAEWNKNDRMVEYVLTKKLKPLVHKLLEACKPAAAGGKRNTRRNRKNRSTTRKH